MRWIALALGLAGIVCGEAAGGAYTTIVSSDAPVSGAPGDATLNNIRQVVLADDGGVAVSATFDLNLDVPGLLYKPSAASVSTIASRGGALYSGLTGTFDDFSNLSLTGGKVSFIAGSNSNQYGLFRFDGTGGAVLFEAQPVSTPSGPVGASLDTVGSPNSQYMPYGINPAGDVSFGALTTPPAPGSQMLTRALGSGMPTRTLNNGDFSLTQFNTNPLSALLYKKVLTASDATVFMAQDSSSARTIYGLDAAPSSVPVARVPAVHNAGGFEYRPIQLMAATGAAATGVTVYAARKTDPLNPSFVEDAILIHSGASTTEVGSFTFSSIPLGLQFEANLEMTTNNRVAAYIPTAAGGQVMYWDPLAGLLQIAAAGSAVTGENNEAFTITDITIRPDSVPMINSSGLVVFDAGIDINGVAPGGFEQALLFWAPSATLPRVLIRSGDTVTINGLPRLITSLIPNLVDGSVGYDSDVLKDGLNDSGFVAFGATYAAAGGDGFAVLSTYVPEPSAAGLVILAALTCRRRRAN